MSEDNFFYDIILRRFQHNKNWVAGFVGSCGSGKSWAAIKLAYDLSKRQGFEFKVEQICFSAKEFYQLVQKRMNNEIPAGSFIVLDESAVVLDADKSRADDDVSGMKHILETFRKYQLGLILTIPSNINFVQKKGRQLLDTVFIMREIRHSQGISVCKVHWLQTNEMSGRIYSHNLTDSEDNAELAAFLIHKPPAELVAAYEAKKDAFAKDLLQQKISAQNKREEKERLEIHGMDFFYKQVMKEPELYLNRSRDSFSYLLVLGRLGLSEGKARALSARLNSDWLNGKISLK